MSMNKLSVGMSLILALVAFIAMWVAFWAENNSFMVLLGFTATYNMLMAIFGKLPKYDA